MTSDHAFDDFLRRWAVDGDMPALSPEQMEQTSQRIINHAMTRRQQRPVRRTPIRVLSGMVACAACVGFGFMIGQGNLALPVPDSMTNDLTLVIDADQQDLFTPFSGDFS